MDDPELLVANTDTVMKNRFCVDTTKEPVHDGDTLYDNNVDQVFNGGNNLADLLFGWGIVRFLVKNGKQVALLFSRDQEFTLPEDRE